MVIQQVTSKNYFIDQWPLIKRSLLDSLFSKQCRQSWTVTCKSMKLEHILTPYSKINSKQLKDLHIRHDPIKLEGNVGKIFSHINCTTVFWGQSPKATEVKAKINKWDLIKHKLLHSKGNHKQKKKQPTDWEKIFAKMTTTTTTKGLIFKLYKHLMQLSNKKPNSIKKWAEDLNKWPKFLQIRYTDGQQTHGKMLNITNY